MVITMADQSPLCLRRSAWRDPTARAESPRVPQHCELALNLPGTGRTATSHTAGPLSAAIPMVLLGWAQRKTRHVCKQNLGADRSTHRDIEGDKQKFHSVHSCVLRDGVCKRNARVGPLRCRCKGDGHRVMYPHPPTSTSWKEPTFFVAFFDVVTGKCEIRKSWDYEVYNLYTVFRVLWGERGIYSQAGGN